ncbi:uncharacterized protein LOC125231490 [Leguminivora glycinivorella]|uniref:uncharacterized protein LOC125231490 n=1 Tax=Leguminivora glycinivorella TaxID=1035111 RepID=UPI00200C4F35|nr:uncharacterized protein LOC125231490 [Leguminivora glycinivorella]
MHILLLLPLVAACTAMPSYIAVPADQIAFVDLSALRVRRVPRQTLTPPPPPPQLSQAQLYREYAAPVQEYSAAPVQEYTPQQQEYPVQYQQQPIALAPEPEAPARIVQIQAPLQRDVASAASALAERPPDFGEYVDFGAHTGDSGAFGWYADYPVNGHDDGSYRK